MRRYRAAADRGHSTTHGVDSRHAFSSGTFHDPAWSGFGALRVLGEHRLDAGAAVEHARANMEVLCYVVSGTVARAPGAAAALGPGTLLWIGAGHGGAGAAATHAVTPAHLVQAWIQPDRVNAAPGDGERRFDRDAGRARWTVLAGAGGGGALPLRQQASLRATVLAGGDRIDLALLPVHRYWLQVVAGTVRADGRLLAAGDGLALEDESGTLHLDCDTAAGAELLLFELPGAR